MVDTQAVATATSDEEFDRSPVPLRARLGFKDPAWVWSGFGIAFICAVIGGLIQQGLGTTRAIAAILLGNAVLFVYTSALGWGSGKWGLNFPLTVKAVFGRRGAAAPILVLALLVTGWYAFQAWLTADILRVLLSIESTAAVGLVAVGIGIVYAIPVIFGIKFMALVRKIAIPAMIIFVIYYLVDRVIPAGNSLFAGSGSGDISFMTGVGMAWATFVVSGTMTGDIVRYTRNGRQSVGVHAVAFMFSNAPFMMMGALMSAAVANSEVVYFFDQDSAAVLVPIAGIAILSNWSTCDACLYNATLGFTNTSNRLTWKSAALVGTVIGLIAAGTGLIGNVTNWLILLGLVVPPIGGVIIADYFFVRGDAHGYGVARTEQWNWAAIIAATAGIAVGWYVNQAFPNFLFGAAGLATPLVLYPLLVSLAGDRLGARLSDQPTGAEAEDLLLAPQPGVARV